MARKILKAKAGELIDFITGKSVKDRPEEHVRQNWERTLVFEYGYQKPDIEPEFDIKSGAAKRRVDIAVFHEGHPHAQENIYIIVETKRAKVSPQDKKEGVDQLATYLSDCPNAEFGVWTNGIERICYTVQVECGLRKAVEIIEIPPQGMTMEQLERRKIPVSLRPATGDNLKQTFRACHNKIAANSGLPKDEAFWELLKLIACKIEDELGDHNLFYITQKEYAAPNGRHTVKARIDRLFKEVIKRGNTIYTEADRIDFGSRTADVVAYVVAQFQGYSLLETEPEVKGSAYEELVGSTLRGDRGEFFTPANVVQMTVKMLDVEPDDIFLDPACGTGKFLAYAVRDVFAKIETDNTKRVIPLSESKVRELQVQYASQRVIGIDFNPNLVQTARQREYFEDAVSSDTQLRIYRENSLEPPHMWDDDLRQAINLRKVKVPWLNGQEREFWVGEVDVIGTNPPFGINVAVDSPEVLDQYELAHLWKLIEKGPWELSPEYSSAVPSEILFIERCVQMLKPGSGHMGMIVPDNILSNPGLGYVRQWILTHCEVLATVDLHKDTFQPSTGTQTSVLVLRRKSFDEMRQEAAQGYQKEYPVFVAIAEKIGHDKRGNLLWKRDKHGAVIKEPVEVEGDDVDEEGNPIKRKVVEHHKILDDELDEIADAYLEHKCKVERKEIQAVNGEIAEI
jgi:type I restriction enzyme M protein